MYSVMHGKLGSPPPQSYYHFLLLSTSCKVVLVPNRKQGVDCDGGSWYWSILVLVASRGFLCKKTPPPLCLVPRIRNVLCHWQPSRPYRVPTNRLPSANSSWFYVNLFFAVALWRPLIMEAMIGVLGQWPLCTLSGHEWSNCLLIICHCRG